MKIRSKKKLYEAIFFSIIGILLLIYALYENQNSFITGWSQSPYLFPIIVSGIILLLSVSLYVQSIAITRADTDISVEDDIQVKTEITQKKNLKGVIISLGMMLCYTLALKYITLPKLVFKISFFVLRLGTFELATFTFLLAFLRYLEVRQKKILFLVPFCTVIFLSFSFRTLLNVLLP
ncbi:tripartite tricarboxylate transporter TctB family protein [Fusibacter ferrireducens]|uniref:Tripartite tricarboxylate transporter TctB family protein n=1 Tax=Fusibacter ferrireducens TaxID=2785058 RepID=A0ABR9ZVT7_9FIRM|nr:tripartite tricarboxylate transporter TctB family protein [Fusibacter ferrireducens]MBF4694278.1 tripartite tricarboxylate transporter TctB family protein [Fusibacter ferrireducens]